MKLLILNGPNLNMLGVREPDIYGDLTLQEINGYICETFKDEDVEFEFFQSNYEGELIDKIHGCHPCSLISDTSSCEATSTQNHATSVRSPSLSSFSNELPQNSLRRESLSEADGCHPCNTSVSDGCHECNVDKNPELIYGCHECEIDGIIYNPGAHTHYSYALHDAVASVSTPVIEVHLSDIKSREDFRKKSVIAPACEAQISGKGKDSYVEAVKIFLKNEGDVFWKRAVKTDEEIKSLKKAQKIADEGFLRTLPNIKVGMTELQVKELLEKKLKDAGAEGFSFETLVGCGANSANIHAEAGDRVIEKGDSIVIDFGVVKDGVCSDTTRTLFAGRPTGEMLRAWMAAKDAHETVAQNLKIGMTGKECHDMAISVLDEYGFKGKMPHGLGHGVGRDIHEKPVLSPRCKAKLVKNNVITIEPGVYIKDKFGIRLEDCGVVTENGFESFTSLTHEMLVI